MFTGWYKKKVSKNFTFGISQNCSSTQVVHTLLFHPKNPDQNFDRNSTDLLWIVHSECMYGQQCQIQHLTPFASQSVSFSEQIKRLVSKTFAKNIVLFNLMFVSVLWKSVFCLSVYLSINLSFKFPIALFTSTEEVKFHPASSFVFQSTSEFSILFHFIIINNRKYVAL